MRKLLSMVVLILMMSNLFAAPISVEVAKSLGQKFVQANFDLDRQSSDMNLVYTVNADNGEPALYVFNVSDNGFVLVSASDLVRPILGYSLENAFDIDNVAPGLGYFLGVYQESISYALENVQTPETWISKEWDNLKETGKLVPENKGYTVGPLVQTKWNQDSPYNYYSPAATGGPGGRCYAGCVATAMGQVMKYWEHPIQGTGSHSYNCPGYGQQSANFGETTYDWDNMPVSLGNNSTQEQIEAVGTLLYHCAVSVDMQFAPDGSGAYSEDVSQAMSSYFGYGPSVLLSRYSYTLDAWNEMLKASFDAGRPIYYAGVDGNYGHAFVCDGYDDNDFMHFNWGWGGADDGFFACDAMDYSSSQRALFNLMPSEMYANTAQAPTNISVSVPDDEALTATVSWTNPTMKINNQSISTINSIVVKRDNDIIYTQDNVQPGEQMSFVDENVPCYSIFKYSVYAVIEDAPGNVALANAIFGPTCEWTITMTSSAFQGWSDGKVAVYNAQDKLIATATTTSSSPTQATIDMPLGTSSFVWREPTQTINNMSIIIKDSDNNTVYNFSGSSDELSAGVFVTVENTCGGTAPAEAPANLLADYNGEQVDLSWDGVSNIGYGYNIYRNGLLIALTQETTFADTPETIGGHCYEVRVLTTSGESAPTNEACANVGEGCDAPSDLWYELNTNGKPKLTWVAPENMEGLSGYMIYRNIDGGEWSRVKLVNANQTVYNETSNLEDGHWYGYMVYAYYQNIDCTSAPANSLYSDYEYFVKIFYSLTGVSENETLNASIYPIPVKDNLTVKAEGITSVSLFNVVGQMIYENNVAADETVINMSDLESGVYIVRITTINGEISRRISVIR